MMTALATGLADFIKKEAGPVPSGSQSNGSKAFYVPFLHTALKQPTFPLAEAFSTSFCSNFFWQVFLMHVPSPAN